MAGLLRCPIRRFGLKVYIFFYTFFEMEINAQKFPSIADTHISIDNVELAYKDAGKGQVLLCLHAIGHSSKDFATLYQLDLQHYRIISLDFPGHGNSQAPQRSVSASYFSEIVLEFIEKLELKDLIIVGNSIGGATAIRVASNNPDISMLVLSNPGGLDKRGFIAPIFLNFMVRFFRKGEEMDPKFKKQFEWYYKNVLTTPASNERRSEITRDCYTLAPLLVQAWTSFKSDEEDLRPLVETITCPVLFTWAIKDKFVQLGRSKSAIKKFKNYKLIKYPIGHTPYVECPAQFLEDFEEFLKGMR